MAYSPQRRKEDRGTGRLWAFFSRFFIVIGIATTISTALIVATISRAASYQPPALPDTIVLTYTFKKDLAEVAGKPSFSQPLLRPVTTLHEITDALHAAAKDPRVKGFLAKLEDPALSLAQIQELRHAVKAFRASGKFTWIYADSYGATSSGLGGYYLAAAFDQIWLQPVGAVSIGGISAEVPFFKGLFDKVGVTAEFAHQGRYKSAPESLTQTGMSAPTRENMSGLIGDLSRQIKEGIALDRNFTPQDVSGLLARAVFVDKEALSEKLVDKIGYVDEMVDEARTILRGAKMKAPDEGDPGGDNHFVELTGYSFLADEATSAHGVAGFVTNLMRRSAPPGTYRDKAKIALIYGAGDIMPFARAGTTYALGLSGNVMAADKIKAAFEEAMDDEDVAAVVFRIDSPGGAPAAAETIRHAMARMQKKGRPVIVSMGSYATSGGYWISSTADKIVAQPGTITGSIGVFGGKMEFSRLADKLGIEVEAISEDPHARMWSSTKPFSKAEFAKFDHLLARVYDAFLERVAEGRGIDSKDISKVAEGRVFTGAQAEKIGLVDALGGLDVAIALAKTEAKMDVNVNVPVVRFPPRKSAFEMFLSLALEGSGASAPSYQLTAADMAVLLKDGLEVRNSQILRLPDVDIIH